MERKMAEFIGDEYRIRKCLSNNSKMSTVYKCTNDEGELFAVKIFDKFPGDEESQKLQEFIFDREVEALKKVQHPNVVRFVECDSDEDLKKFYIVLEYIDGNNLKEALPSLATYSEYEKIELFDQICIGVEYLHKKELIHRDLKPSNIMLTEDGKIKIIDFGISKLEDTFYDDCTVVKFNTPTYCSPEQEQGKEVTQRSDIYSLGLICYEIFTGIKVEKNHAFDISCLSEGIRDIISKMLKPEPELRYLSVTEIRKDLATVKNRINQEKIIVLGITKKVSEMLYQNGYIEKDEITYAAVAVKNDLQGRCYVLSQKKDEDKLSYQIVGKQFLFICQRNKNNYERLTIITVRFLPIAVLMELKEKSYEIPYSISVQASVPKVMSGNEVLASDLIDELMEFEYQRDLQKNVNINNKEVVNKWREILALQRKKLDAAKASVDYRGFRTFPSGDYIEVELYKNLPSDEIKFESEDMLQMTAKGKGTRNYNVGYIRDYYNGVLTIDLAAETDVKNIASMGEVSINKNMMEIALKRQEQALKTMRFKESVNPRISDIIFSPQKATSKNNVLLSTKDCHSKLIDDSKRKSLEKALAADDIFLLQGPPGTGKTTFISELVCQVLDRNPNSKILIASQSHVAVDHSLTKIKELMPSIKLIRVGLKEKFSESVIDYTLDKFCQEWTQEVITKCERAIAEYKESIGLDDSLQEKNTIIMEIEKLMAAVSEMIDEMKVIEEEQDKLDILEDKWKFINETIILMEQTVNTKTNHVSEKVLNNIVDTFTTNLRLLNKRLEDIVEESVHLSSQKEKLESRYIELNSEIESSRKEIDDWKEMLGVSDDPAEYELYKKELRDSIKENQEKYNRYSKIESLCKEWVRRVKQGEGLLQESLLDATVVGATCLGIASLGNKIDLKFDWVIVDEAGKATPTEVLVPICLGNKIVMVGDHKQLPPVVDETLLEMSNTTLDKKDLETSLFEYMELSLSESCKSILNEQYRMHPVIGELIGTMFYRENGLISKTNKEEKTIPLKVYDNKALVWLSTCRMDNNREERLGVTYRNTCEARIIFEQLLIVNEELKEMGITKEVAIIAGYKAQKDLIRRLYYSEYESKFNSITVEINTVDAFQGRETDIVFYSVVRSNDNGNLGFLKDMRRLNVAFSRAKELLVVVGNHQCASKQLQIDGQENPFVGIVQFILEHEEDCMLKEV